MIRVQFFKQDYPGFSLSVSLITIQPYICQWKAPSIKNHPGTGEISSTRFRNLLKSTVWSERPRYHLIQWLYCFLPVLTGPHADPRKPLRTQQTLIGSLIVQLLISNTDFLRWFRKISVFLKNIRK